MQLRLLTFYFRSTKGSQKIFLGSQLGTVPSFSYKNDLERNSRRETFRNSDLKLLEILP